MTGSGRLGHECPVDPPKVGNERAGRPLALEVDDGSWSKRPRRSEARSADGYVGHRRDEGHGATDGAG